MQCRRGRARSRAAGRVAVAVAVVVGVESRACELRAVNRLLAVLSAQCSGWRAGAG